MTPDMTMAATDGVTREEMHHRALDLRGYSRSDGLFEVVARLTDRKPHAFLPPGSTTEVAAGGAVHDMVLTVVFDAALVVRAVAAVMNAHPYATCIGGGDSLQALVGLSMTAGWNSEVRKRLPACDTCTHLREMLGPLASTAFQTLTVHRPRGFDARDASGRPVKIDTCHAYGATRDLVRQHWPEYYRPADGAAVYTKSVE